MIRSFADKDSRRLFEGKRVKRFRTIERQAQKRLRYLHNDQWRICFRWTEQGAEDVEIVDYH